NFVHTFANVGIFVFVNGQWVIQPLTTLQTNGFQVVNFQTISTVVTNPPFLPATQFEIRTIIANHLRIQPGPVGEFFIFPTNFCDVVINSVAFTNVIPIVTQLFSSSNTTVNIGGGTNAAGGTNLFSGQVLSNTVNLVTFFTNHLFIV